LGGGSVRPLSTHLPQLVFMNQTQFQFNAKLWLRFIETAQPYFFPLGLGTTPIFLGLILALLVFVVCFTFFLVLGLTFAGEALFPAFFKNGAEGLVTQVDWLARSWFPLIFVGLLFICGGTFFLQRQNLRQRWKQWVLLGLLLFLLFVVNGLNVILSFVFRFIDTALNQKNSEVFWQFLWVYGLVIIAAIPIIVAYRYLRLKIGLLWREWLTQHYLNRYFRHRSYYRLDSNAVNVELDNPDQRITQDVKAFTTVTLDFLFDILDSILTLLSFTAILYNLSQTLTWGLLGYAIFGTVVVIFIGTRLIRINYEQLRLEANFRYSLVRVRDNAESIAFYQGENLERNQVVDRLSYVLKNFDLLIIWQSVISLFQLGYNYFTRLIPYLVVAPLYLTGKLDFGAIVQSSVAFSQVLSALSLVTNQIQGITEFAASINRLGEFYESLTEPAVDINKPSSVISTQISPILTINHLTLRPPHSPQVLIQDLSLRVEEGDHLLIMGASGSGKSSLLRAVAGLWIMGQGEIDRPVLDDLLFLPQRPYMIRGTLKEQLLYPKPEQYVDEQFLQSVLTSVNLPGLVQRFGGFDAEENWENLLSLGEQQRIAIGRVLVNRPRYAILDEATSALDIGNEETLYHSLQQLGTTYISVGHRPSLSRYHRQCLEILEGGGWHLRKL
jgi:vitamin B12/bleomycin/antimicrobial peptide transport system ATP-binding/permease protein